MLEDTSLEVTWFMTWKTNYNVKAEQTNEIILRVTLNKSSKLIGFPLQVLYLLCLFWTLSKFLFFE